MQMKQKGILLHFSSLPGDFGIGDLGPEAVDFAQFLKEQGFSIWQTLPLNHRGYGNSPYNPISAFALDPLLVSPQLLYESGLIDVQDLNEAKMPSSDRVFFEEVMRKKTKLLDLAASQYLKNHNIESFITENASWLKPYISFVILDKLYEDIHWSQWQPRHRRYSPDLWMSLLEDFAGPIYAQAAIQAIIRDQLSELKQKLDELEIELWGDLPIYLSYHSSEVWAQPELFAMDDQGRRLAVAGVPPDAFSEDGQLWGNPIYLWDTQPEAVFSLFEARVADALKYADRLRLDHFIGYINYWSVPCPTDEKGRPVMPLHAREGAWIKAPGEQMFRRLTSKFGPHPFIAEDLGILTEEVCAVRERFGFPGMIVLQFCFNDPNPDIKNYPSDRIIYTGTHDNPTTRQWFEELEPDGFELYNFNQYIRSQLLSTENKPDNAMPEISPTLQNAAQLMINVAIDSGCQIAVFPMQDILNLDAEARMNIPGTPLGNWEWRMAPRDFI